MKQTIKTAANKESEELIKKHYLLEAYSMLSEGGKSLDDDPNLIEDNKLPSPKNEEAEEVDYFVNKGEMKRYKTKSGMYNGYPCTWIMQVTKKGFEAVMDKKYLKEAEDLNYKDTQLLLGQLQIKEIKNNRMYAIIGALGGSILTIIADTYGKDILTAIQRLLNK